MRFLVFVATGLLACVGTSHSVWAGLTNNTDRLSLVDGGQLNQSTRSNLKGTS